MRPASPSSPDSSTRFRQARGSTPPTMRCAAARDERSHLSFIPSRTPCAVLRSELAWRITDRASPPPASKEVSRRVPAASSSRAPAPPSSAPCSGSARRTWFPSAPPSLPPRVGARRPGPHQRVPPTRRALALTRVFRGREGGSVCRGTAATLARTLRRRRRSRARSRLSWNSLRRDETRRDETRRAETRRDETRRDETRRDHSNNHATPTPCRPSA